MGVFLGAFTYPAYTVLRLMDDSDLGIWMIEAFYVNGSDMQEYAL